MKEIKPKIQKVIKNWYKNCEYEIIQVWEQEDTWFIVVKLCHNDPEYLGLPDELQFIRIFPSYRIKGEYHLSVDNTVDV